MTSNIGSALSHLLSCGVLCHQFYGFAPNFTAINGTSIGTITETGTWRVQDSADTRYMVEALTDLGLELKVDWEGREMVVHGCGGRFPAPGGELYLGNAGTAMR